MSLSIEIVNGITSIKEGDTVTPVEMRLVNGNGTAYDVTGSSVNVLIANESGKILEKPAEIGDKTGVVSFKVDEGEITGHGSMFLEIHVTEDDGLKIFPSDGTISFKIDKNINIVGETVTSITLQHLFDTFNEQLVDYQVEVNELFADAYEDAVSRATINRFFNPVANFAALTTTYPSAQYGDAVQTLDDNKTYRFNGTSWIYIEQFGAGPFDNVYKRLDEQRYFVNVREFGAIGNGTTDDTAAFTSAIASCVNGSVLWIPQGYTFLLSSRLDIPVSLRISGGGKIKFSTVVDTSEQVLFDFNRQISTEDQIMYGIRIENIDFEGTVSNNSRELPQTMLRTWFCDDVLVTNCTFKNLNIAIRPQNTKNISVVGNIFKKLFQTNTDKINGYGLMLETTQNVNVSANTFVEVERHSIYLNHFNNATVTGNIFIGNSSYVARTGYEMPIKLTDGDGCTIVGNRFRYTVGGISIIEFGTGTKFTENVVISNNVFEDYVTNNSIVTGFVFLKSLYMKNIKIHNNIFRNAFNHFIQFTGSGDIDITGNTFDTGTQGVRVETTSTDARLTISNNRFSNLTGNCINATNTNSKIFGQNNGFKNCSSGVANFTTNPNNMVILDSYDVENPGPKSISGSGGTPDVKLGTIFKINNSTATNITALANGSKGQRVTLYFTNGNNTLKHSSFFFLKAKADVVTELGMTKDFVQVDFGSWFEV